MGKNSPSAVSDNGRYNSTIFHPQHKFLGFYNYNERVLGQNSWRLELQSHSHPPVPWSDIHYNTVLRTHTQPPSLLSLDKKRSCNLVLSACDETILSDQHTTVCRLDKRLPLPWAKWSSLAIGSPASSCCSWWPSPPLLVVVVMVPIIPIIRLGSTQPGHHRSPIRVTGHHLMSSWIVRVMRVIGPGLLNLVQKRGNERRLVLVVTVKRVVYRYWWRMYLSSPYTMTFILWETTCRSVAHSLPNMTSLWGYCFQLHHKDPLTNPIF